MIHSLLPSTAAAALLAAAAAPAGTPRPVPALVSLSATPAHLVLVAGRSQTLRVRNDGGDALHVLAAPAAFAFDLYGNAALGSASGKARSARPWLTARPARFTLPPHGERTLKLTARPPRRASAGDHHALVLLSAQMPRSSQVAIRTRLGVLVIVRVPGRIVRRLAIRRAWVLRTGSRREIVVAAVNRGNVAERFQPGELTVTLRRAGRIVAVAGTLPRDLLPGARGLFVAPIIRSLRGSFTVVVGLAAQPRGSAGVLSPRLPDARKVLRLRL